MKLRGMVTSVSFKNDYFTRFTVKDDTGIDTFIFSVKNNIYNSDLEVGEVYDFEVDCIVDEVVRDEDIRLNQKCYVTSINRV